MVIWLLLIIFGLIVGSFISVVIYRETQENPEPVSHWQSWLPPWVLGRSQCDHCKHELAWYDNIPLLSFLFLKGKCRSCQHPIQRSYPLVELLMAVQFVWIYWLLKQLSFFQQMEGSYSFLVLGFWLFIVTLSLALAWIDLKTQLLPDSLTYTGIAVAVLRLFVTGRWEFLWTGLGLFLFFLGLFVLTRGKGMGFGDVKLAFFIGVVLGWWQWAVVAMVIAFLTGAIVGVILIALNKKGLKSAIPFGPFMLGGMIVAKVFGDAIWMSYMRSLGL